MQEPSDHQLLRDYVEHGHEAAFREIVSRHADVVYASALRQAGSPDLARDIAQSVFTDLARKAQSLAGTLTGDVSLLGWLYRSTRFAALNQWRDDRRRQARERQAMQQLDPASETAPEWERVQPVLDEAMAELSDEDREALLLRFFKDRDFRAIGVALGISDDAAQKRVSRALERLRTGLTNRGVTTTAGALSALLTASTVSFAPAGLAATLSTTALVGTTLATTTTATLTKAIAMTTLQKTLVAVTVVAVTVVAASLATPLVIQHQSQTRLRVENQTLRAQIAQLNQSATKRAATSPTAATNSDRQQFNELLRLRGEVARLRRDSQELTQLKAGKAQTPSDPATSEFNLLLARVNELKQKLNEKPDLKIPELQFLTPQDWLNVAAGAKLDTDSGARQALSRLRSAAKLAFSPMLQEALTRYVQASGGQLPTEISQLKPYFGTPVDDALLDRYQLLRTGKASDVPAPEQGITTNTERATIRFRPPTSQGSIIAEKVKVDADFDSVLSIGLNGSHLNEQGPIGSGLDLVTRSTILRRGITRTNN